jgi:prepilin-type N-terminal cleavage/methylation domain-containing protein
MRRRRTASAAFTLIELLVVIGIIALLISILLPTLNKVRQQALNANCASNLRQIGQGCMSYAADYKGFLPARFREGAEDYLQPLYTYFPQDKKASPIQRYGMGLLWERKYIKTEQVFYCPGGRAAPDHNLDTFKKPWLSAVGSSDPNYRTSYTYNPHFAYRTFGDSGSGRVTAYARVTKFPRTKALAADIIRTPGTISHYSGGERTPSWNMLFIDGHVVLVKSMLVVNQMKARGGDPGDDQGNPTGTSQANWLLLDDYRDILETYADGKNPMDLRPVNPLVNRVKH